MNDLAVPAPTISPDMEALVAAAERGGLKDMQVAVTPDGVAHLLIPGLFGRDLIAIVSLDGSYLRAEVPNIQVAGRAATAPDVAAVEWQLIRTVALLDFHHRGPGRLGLDSDGEVRAIVVLPMGAPVDAVLRLAFAELTKVLTAFDELWPGPGRIISDPAATPFGPIPGGNRPN